MVSLEPLNLTPVLLLYVAMAEFEVPVTHCEVWAVTTAFDSDSSGQVSEGSENRHTSLYLQQGTAKGLVAVDADTGSYISSTSPALLNQHHHNDEIYAG